MRCHECQEIMHRFIDGKVDSETRKRLGFHIAECQECARLIEDDQFWDDAILSFLDQRAPCDLRAQILGDASSGGHDNNDASQGNKAKLTWQAKTKFILWQATRGYSHKLWLKSIIVLIEVYALIFIVRWLIEHLKN